MQTTTDTTPPESFFCKRCHAIISKEQHDESIKKNWLPLCFECEPETREKFEKWYPLFQKLKR